VPMKIILTAREITDAYLWDEFCSLRGINVYARAEGQVASDEEFTFDEDEIKKLNLVKHLKKLETNTDEWRL
jgi:hypothetical protein